MQVTFRYLTYNGNGYKPYMAEDMTTKNIGYFTDFLVFPAVLLALVFAPRSDSRQAFHLAEALAILAGIVTWSFLEYAIHRFILHNDLWFAQDHDQHHAAPKAFIATPTWLTLLILVFAVYLPSIYCLGLDLGSAFGFGVTSGYLFYSFVHFILHHWDARPGGLFYKWKRTHALHHYAGKDRNFGVTSSFWDYVFSTLASPKDDRAVLGHREERLGG